MNKLSGLCLSVSDKYHQEEAKVILDVCSKENSNIWEMQNFTEELWFVIPVFAYFYDIPWFLRTLQKVSIRWNNTFDFVDLTAVMTQSSKFIS